MVESFGLFRPDLTNEFIWRETTKRLQSMRVIAGVEQRSPVVGNEVWWRSQIGGGKARQRRNVVSVERQSLLEVVADPPHIFGCEPSVHIGLRPEEQVRGAGARRSLRLPRLRSDHLRGESVGQPRDNLVLHVEQVGQRLVKPLRTEMMARLGVDQLDVDVQVACVAP